MPIHRIHLTTLTHNTKDSGTDSEIVLIVNDRGDDVLHWTVYDSWKATDLERGEANVYHKIQLSNDVQDINPGRLQEGSIRVGIRGGDLWRPQHIAVIGHDRRLGRPTLFAIETNLSTTLSTDEDEGNISLPVELIDEVRDSQQLDELLLIMHTRTSPEHAGTDSKLELQVSTTAGVKVVYEIPDTPQKEQEAGSGNMYFIPVSDSFSKSELEAHAASGGDPITLRIKGQDMWHPYAIFLFGLINGPDGKPAGFVPLVYQYRDGNDVLTWMSTDPSEGVESLVLPMVG